LETAHGYPAAGPKLHELEQMSRIYDLSQGNLDAIKEKHLSITTELVDVLTDAICQKYDVHTGPASVWITFLTDKTLTDRSSEL
jgi:hypothetical protein